MTEPAFVGWVLEQGDRPRRYLGVILGILDWTTDPAEALQLARREDADALAEVVEDADRIVPPSASEEPARSPPGRAPEVDADLQESS